MMPPKGKRAADTPGSPWPEPLCPLASRHTEKAEGVPTGYCEQSRVHTGVRAPLLPFAPTRMDPGVNAKRNKSDTEGQTLCVITYM